MIDEKKLEELRQHCLSQDHSPDEGLDDVPECRVDESELFDTLATLLKENARLTNLLETATLTCKRFEEENAELKRIDADCLRSREKLEAVARAAKNLWDNRLGHRPDNPVWHSPRDIWEPLGGAIAALEDGK